VALHPNAQKSHEAAHCASEQGKYWEMHDRLFGNIGGHEGQELAAQAKALRLDVRKFEQCLASGRHAATVTKAIEEGQRAGVHGTPTFFVGVSGDGRTVKATRILRGAQPYESASRQSSISPSPTCGNRADHPLDREERQTQTAEQVGSS
jgi:protein-disulfide isomerase